VNRLRFSCSSSFRHRIKNTALSLSRPLMSRHRQYCSTKTACISSSRSDANSLSGRFSLLCFWGLLDTEKEYSSGHHWFWGGATMSFLKHIVNQSMRVKAMREFRTLCLVLAVFLVCVPTFSQGNLGHITGTITDQSGGVIAGATVTVKDVARGVSRTLTTTDSGEYNAPNLLPGSYAVRAEAKGFRATEQQNILLEVGKEIRVDVSLQPGEVSQTITISEAPPMVETTNATLGGTLSNETINDLPLNGRNYINLLTLRPGMNVYAGGGSFTRSANGTRAEDIGYLIDGLRNDDSFTGSSVLNAAIPAGDSSTSLPIDAIQEFNTEQNPKAEFGWKPGAIVNAGIKSGTNSIHGTAFAFGRDTALDARNFFDAAPLPKAAIGL